MSALSESVLRQRIVARLVAQELPLAREPKIFAGYGQNESCDACEQLIRPNDVIYEIELNNDRADQVVLAMHRVCFAAWLELS